MYYIHLCKQALYVSLQYTLSFQSYGSEMIKQPLITEFVFESDVIRNTYLSIYGYIYLFIFRTENKVFVMEG